MAQITSSTSAQLDLLDDEAKALIVRTAPFEPAFAGKDYPDVMLLLGVMMHWHYVQTESPTDKTFKPSGPYPRLMRQPNAHGDDEIFFVLNLGHSNDSRIDEQRTRRFMTLFENTTSWKRHTNAAAKLEKAPADDARFGWKAGDNYLRLPVTGLWEVLRDSNHPGEIDQKKLGSMIKAVAEHYPARAGMLQIGGPSAPVAPSDPKWRNKIDSFKNAVTTDLMLTLTAPGMYEYICNSQSTLRMAAIDQYNHQVQIALEAAARARAEAERAQLAAEAQRAHEKDMMQILASRALPDMSQLPATTGANITVDNSIHHINFGMRGQEVAGVIRAANEVPGLMVMHALQVAGQSADNMTRFLEAYMNKSAEEKAALVQLLSQQNSEHAMTTLALIQSSENIATHAQRAMYAQNVMHADHLVNLAYGAMTALDVKDARTAALINALDIRHADTVNQMDSRHTINLGQVLQLTDRIHARGVLLTDRIHARDTQLTNAVHARDTALTDRVNARGTSVANNLIGLVDNMNARETHLLEVMGRINHATVARALQTADRNLLAGLEAMRIQSNDHQFAMKLQSDDHRDAMAKLHTQFKIGVIGALGLAGYLANGVISLGHRAHQSLDEITAQHVQLATTQVLQQGRTTEQAMATLERTTGRESRNLLTAFGAGLLAMLKQGEQHSADLRYVHDSDLNTLVHITGQDHEKIMAAIAHADNATAAHAQTAQLLSQDHRRDMAMLEQTWVRSFEEQVGISHHAIKGWQESVSEMAREHASEIGRMAASNTARSTSSAPLAIPPSTTPDHLQMPTPTATPKKEAIPVIDGSKARPIISIHPRVDLTPAGSYRVVEDPELAQSRFQDAENARRGDKNPELEHLRRN